MDAFSKVSRRSGLLRNKVIVVTGGAGLLGSTFCSAISACGGTAIVADVNEESAKLLADKIRTQGGAALAVGLNINVGKSIEDLLHRLVTGYGGIHGLVNNAYPRNTNYGRKLESVTYADFVENVSTHLGGYFLVSQKFADYFKARGEGGAIVNMGSIYGTMVPRFEMYEGTEMTMPVEYAAAKSAIIHMTKYFAQYFKADGIRVNALSPGGIFDGQPKAFVDRYTHYGGAKGMLATEDVVGALLFLLSDEARYVTGQNLIVDDGFSL